jgi:hypothetical protein
VRLRIIPRKISSINPFPEGILLLGYPETWTFNKHHVESAHEIIMCFKFKISSANERNYREWLPKEGMEWSSWKTD